MKDAVKNSGNSSEATSAFTASSLKLFGLAIRAFENLYAYADWLDRMLPSREQPPEVEIT